MMTPILRFLIPRGMLLFPKHTSRVPFAVGSSQRHMSASASKPRVLEKPTKFSPPSHGRRLKERTPQHLGAELTQEQKIEQQTKSYPSMMPPRGTFTHWFLTNRSIHVWITMGTLTCLAAFATWENWCRSTTFRDRLPSRDKVLRNPIDSFWQAWGAWKMYNQETSAKANAQRKMGIDDAQKRASYRKAHGGGDDQGMEFWPPFEEKYGKRIVDEKTGRLIEGGVPDAEGQKRRMKRWFGIW